LKTKISEKPNYIENMALEKIKPAFCLKKLAPGKGKIQVFFNNLMKNNTKYIQMRSIKIFLTLNAETHRFMCLE
jgi:hypothetical protein